MALIFTGIVFAYKFTPQQMMICYESISISTNNRFSRRLLLRLIHRILHPVVPTKYVSLIDFLSTLPPTLQIVSCRCCWLLRVHNMSPIKQGGGVPRRRIVVCPMIICRRCLCWDYPKSKILKGVVLDFSIILKFPMTGLCCGQGSHAFHCKT